MRCPPTTLDCAGKQIHRPRSRAVPLLALTPTKLHMLAQAPLLHGRYVWVLVVRRRIALRNPGNAYFLGDDVACACNVLAMSVLDPGFCMRRALPIAKLDEMAKARPIYLSKSTQCQLATQPSPATEGEISDESPHFSSNIMPNILKDDCDAAAELKFRAAHPA